MKNLKLTITTLLIIICSQKIWAIDFFYNGIAYIITSSEFSTVEVTYYDFNYYSGDIIIPETVTDFSHIDEEREYTVTSIGAMAFYKSSELKTVTLPNTVTKIGHSAFYDCPSLTSINIPNSVTTIAQAAFSGCSSLTSIDIPSSVTSIEGQAFENCSGLTSITIPNTVTYLSGYCTFTNCTGLVTLNLPNSFADDIGLCIGNCTSLTSINFAEGNPRYKSHDGIVFSHEMDSLLKYPQGRQGEYSIPYSVKAIGDGAFSGTAGLTSINIPSTVTSIGHYAFTNCISLNSFALPNSVTKMGENIFKGCTGLTGPVYNNRLFAFCPSNYTSTYHIPDGVETIVGTAFQDCTGIDSVTIPSSVKTIGFNAFSRCGMTYVSLPESLDSIKSYAFFFCSQLSTINLPNSLKYIGTYAFAYCDNLREPLFNDHYFAHFPKNFVESYSIPEGIQEVLEYAFQDCDSLVSLSFPSSVNKIRNNAIDCCPNLFEFYFYPDIPPVIGDFYPWSPNRPDEIYFYVPAGTLDLYLMNSVFGGMYYCSIIEMSGMLSGKEMYYEILNDDGSITYQHLEYMADTIIGNERPEIIVRSNTHYDRDEIITEVTHEYVFERDSKVYWWNKTTEEFTTLYDYRAIVGDEWDIKVGNETITVHVDSTNTFCGYNNLNYRLLYISDVDNIFSGTIVCGIGHLSSFFPEKLMSQDKNFRVEGMRCYWKNGVLVFKNGEVDCDEIYEQYHYDVEEKETEAFRIYPNPTEGIMTVETQNFESLPYQTYRITNLMGQTVMLGMLNADNQQIDITKLPSGMYFVSVGEQNYKIIKK